MTSGCSRASTLCFAKFVTIDVVIKEPKHCDRFGSLCTQHTAHIISATNYIETHEPRQKLFKD